MGYLPITHNYIGIDRPQKWLTADILPKWKSQAVFSGLYICCGSKMASKLVVHDSVLSRNVENTTIPSSGIPQDVLDMLDKAGVITCGKPKWSLRITSDKIYLDLAWSKTLSFPAKSPVNSHDRTVSKTTKEKQSPVGSSSPLDIPKEIPKKRKRKSPSTRKRDKRRFHDWLLKRQARQSKPNNTGLSQAPVNQPHENPPQPTLSSAAENHVCLRPSQPHGQRPPEETDPAMSVPESVQQPMCMDPSFLQESTNTIETDNSIKSKTHRVPLITSFDKQLYDRIFQDNCNNSRESSTESETDSEDDHIDLDLKFCHNRKCMKPERETSDGLKKCTRCMSSHYCSRSCQAEHWVIHKTVCHLLAGSNWCLSCAFNYFIANVFILILSVSHLLTFTVDFMLQYHTYHVL